MKHFFALTAAAAVMTLASCGGGTDNADTTTADTTKVDTVAKEVTYTIDTAASTANWAGTMAGVYTHKGHIKLNEGSLMLKGNALTGGYFVVNMKTIVPTDSNFNAKEKHTPENLIGHLSSKDFFAVDSFPTATFKITSVTGNTATGDLTVRGKTNSENVTDVVVTPNADGTVKATGKLVFDRQKYGVSWKATMKDMVLENNIELNVELTGKAQ